MEEYTERTAVAHDLLAWYRGLGVDEAIGEDAIDWLERPAAPPGAAFRLEQTEPAAPAPSQGTPAARSPAPDASPPVSVTASRTAPRAPAPTLPTGPRQFPTASPDAAVMAARTAAAAAPTLEALRASLEGFNGCALKATAKHLCFYRGAPRARLMVIGEAPGRDEDLSGMPFVGPAGKLLDKMLAAIGLSEADVHITNSVYWRPPGNRTPSQQETQVCRPFLDRQIELVEPAIIALLGGAAANQMLGLPEGIMKLRGVWRELEIGGRGIKTIASLHPAFLLRTPIQKRLAWRDMMAISVALEGTAAAQQ